MPNFVVEKKLKRPVIGVDEVGRGPLAGPVVSCAFIFFDFSIPIEKLDKINDSKKLTSIQRKKALNIILDIKKEKKLDFEIGSATVGEIDKLNILNATILSMKRAILKLKQKTGSIIVDGNVKFKVDNFFLKNIIKGDQISLSIAAASIIAKTYRDSYMKKIGRNYPHFNWSNNAGYGTAEHINQLYQKGITRHHRRSFKPIKDFIQNNYSSC